jgi:hypothetical protein
MSGLLANPHAWAKPKAENAIEAVVEQFRLAIIKKDKPLFVSLFFSNKPEAIGWQYVSEDIRLEKIKKDKPNAIKARRIPSNNFLSLIDEVVSTTEAREETVSNLKIDTDGDVASVGFDYTFLANGKKTNWGKKFWQLVRTENGWKIFSVVYTIRNQLSE